MFRSASSKIRPVLEVVRRLLSPVVAARRRNAGRKSLAAAAIDVLEQRSLLTTMTWDRADHLTFSIVPDGTKIAGEASTFHSSFASVGTPSQLRRLLVDSFQEWTQYAGVNVGYVNDGGQALGVPGDIQGDKRFGDIRIGAASMSDDVLAVSIPHTGAAAGTWAGDIIFNSNFHPANAEQFKAVAMHEIGHALGLQHSSDPRSPMFPQNSPSTPAQPTAEDIFNLRALHGVRIDRNELQSSNDDIRSATPIRQGSYTGTVPLLNYGDISSAADTDYWMLDRLPDYDGPVTVRLRVGGLSLLQASLTIRDENGQVLGSANGLWTGHDLTVTLPSMSRSVYVQVSCAPGNHPFKSGRYGLVTTYDTRNTISAARINEVVRLNFDFLRSTAFAPLFQNGAGAVFFDDLHANDTIRTADTLKTAPGFAEKTRYEFQGTISDLTDVDFYAITSPSSLPSGSVLTVTVDAAELQSLQPVAAVFNKSFQFLTPTILRNGNGSVTIQIPNVVAGEKYLIRVSAAADAERYRTGNYVMKARFVDTPETQNVLLKGILSTANAKQFHEITVRQTMLFNFALETTRYGRTSASPSLAAQATLYSQSGQELHRLVSVNESTRSANSLMLLPGTYYLRVNGVARNGESFSSFAFRLLGSVMSDPVGPIGTKVNEAPPTSGTLEQSLTYSGPSTFPPPTLGSQTATENPFVYQPAPDPVHLFQDYQDWYWYFGIL